MYALLRQLSKDMSDAAASLKAAAKGANVGVARNAGVE